VKSLACVWDLLAEGKIRIRGRIYHKEIQTSTRIWCLRKGPVRLLSQVHLLYCLLCCVGATIGLVLRQPFHQQVVGVGNSNPFVCCIRARTASDSLSSSVRNNNINREELTKEKMFKQLRLVMFRHALGEPIDRVGLLCGKGQKIIDFTAQDFANIPGIHGRAHNMKAIIAGGDETMNAIREIAKKEIPDHLLLAAKSVVLRPPMIPHRNIICVGKNYVDHIAEVSKRDAKDGKPNVTETPKFPMFFTKAPQTVIADLEKVELHEKLTKWLDYEVELAVIIGKQCRDVAPHRAMEKVFGYTIANDVTARDLQRRHGQFFKGKTLDTTCPLGPCIIPATDLDASDLDIKLTLNGEVKQHSRTSKMIFKIPELIASLSEGFTLYPGDIILTGTPDGVAYAANPPFALKHGDTMKAEIEGIGSLENTVERVN
jgi:2-keto-4-pentenoate hydratase/2-oxohepta-3-ene-1,7-dioic acid hydratase in catechol pathway